MLLNRVDADAGVAPYHAKQALVVHRLEQVRRRARRAAPVVAHDAMGELRVDLPRVHLAAFADEREHGVRARVGGRWWKRCAVRGCISACTARVTKP